MGRHIHGSPTFVMRNMPGAGGIVAASWLANVAPKDGSTIGAIYPGAIMSPILQPEGKLTYNPALFRYIGSADSSVYVCATYHSSGVKTYADAREKPLVVGASSSGSTIEFANLHIRAGGVKFKAVMGYKGTGDIMLAMERGEVSGLCGLDWASVQAQRPDWLRDGKLNFIVQDSLEPNEELSKRGTPHALTLITDPLDRAAAELVFSQQVFGRPYLAPQGTPEARVAILREAFMKTMTDDEFLSDAKKSRLSIFPSDGVKVEELIRRAFNASEKSILRARELIAP
ncbi:MAG: Bug family tripartite tricarboxylate transporter substrate binding protein [Beijerinckiaceae bacterium]